MATRTAPQTAAVESETVREDDRASAPFTFKDREVDLYEPTRGQRFILLQVVGVTDDDAPDEEKMELVIGFGQMLRALFVEPGERMAVTGALARGTADVEDYFDLARQMVAHWQIEDEPAPNRQARRSRERRPAKAVPGRRR